MKFLAVDPSSTILGWAVFEDENLLSWGVIDTTRRAYAYRFMYIIEELGKLHRAHGFTELACERAIRFAGRRIPALEVAVTSIRKWAEKRKLKVDFYSPAEWKSSAVGNGGAGKEEVARVICMAYPQVAPGQSDHVTDAIAIGHHHYGVRRIERMAADG